MNVHTQFIPHSTSNFGNSNVKPLNVKDATKPQYKNVSIQTTTYVDRKSSPKIDTLNVSTQTNLNPNLIIRMNNHAIINKKETETNKSLDQANITTINSSNGKREGSSKRNNTDISVDVDIENYQLSNISNNFVNTPTDVKNISEGQSAQKNLLIENFSKNTSEDEKYIAKEKLKDYEIDLDSLSSDEEFEDEILQILECKARLCRQQLT